MPSRERLDAKRRGGFEGFACRRSRESLDVELVLLGVGDDLDGESRLRSLVSDGRKRVDGQQCAAGGVGECLRGHDADAQAGGAAGTAAALVSEEVANGGRQVAGMPACFVETAFAQQPLALGQRDEADAVRCLDDEQQRLLSIFAGVHRIPA